MNTATEPEPRVHEHAGFDVLFDESFEPMKRLAFLLGADDPENVAQEAFVRLHARWATLLATLSRRQRQVVVLWCFENTAGAPLSCYGVPRWDRPYVFSVSVPLPHQVLFVAAPRVDTLEVVNSHGIPVAVRELARTAQATYYLADLAGPTKGSSYTARDRVGKVIDSSR